MVVGMTQNERWNVRYQEVVDFIEANKRNPSKHDEEREVSISTGLRLIERLLMLER